MAPLFFSTASPQHHRIVARRRPIYSPSARARYSIEIYRCCCCCYIKSPSLLARTRHNSNNKHKNGRSLAAASPVLSTVPYRIASAPVYGLLSYYCYYYYYCTVSKNNNLWLVRSRITGARRTAASIITALHVVLVIFIFISCLVCFLAEIIIPFLFSLSTHSRLVLDRDE